MSDLITADLVLLDENLGETRFDVIAKLARPRRPDFLHRCTRWR